MVGPYGSGKTQFLYHIFDFAWKLSVPAVFVEHAGQILKDFKSSGENDIVNWLDAEIARQLDAIRLKQYDRVTWFPSYVNKHEKINEFSQKLSEFERPYRCVLLVDELEQAYGEFLKTIPTSDYSPLRVILDSLQNAFMIWSFGLLSAYEFIGGADLRRFEEIRLPPVTAGLTRAITYEGHKALANFIWWFSQGRLGWVQKLDSEAPQNKEEWAKWVDDSCAEFLEGNVRLINPVWRKVLDPKDWEQGIKAVLFLPDAFKTWVIEDDWSLKVEDTTNTFVEMAKKRMPLEETEIKMLYDRVNCLFDGFATEDMLPLQTFVMGEEFYAIIEILLDHIIAFEPKNRARDNLIENFRSVDKGGLHRDILEKLYNLKKDITSRTIPPHLLKQIFPAPIVNPDLLSMKSVEDIMAQLEGPVTISLPEQDDVRIKIEMCFKRSHFENLMKTLQSNKFSELCQLRTIHLFVVPPEQSWKIETKLQPFEQAGKIMLQSMESRRLFDFAIKLWDYIQNKGEPVYTLDSKLISKLIEAEPRREVRRTLEELWEQLTYWLSETIKKRASNYKDKLAIENSFLWRTAILADEHLYWTSGRMSDPIEGFSYCFVVDEDKITDSEKWLFLPHFLKVAYDNNLIKRDETRFPFKELLDRVFTREGLVSKVRRHAEQLGLKNVPEKFLRLRTLLESLVEMYGVGALSVLESIDREEANDNKVPILKDLEPSEGSFPRSPNLLRGMLISIAAQKQVSNLKSSVEGLIRDIEGEKTRVEEFEGYLARLQELLSPPSPIDFRGISIKSRLDEYKQNIGDVLTCFRELLQDLFKREGIAGIALVFTSIGRQYLKLLEAEIDKMESLKPDLNELEVLEEVKSTYNTTRAYVEALDANFFLLTRSTKESLLAHLDELGKNAFQLQTVIGGPNLDISSDQLQNNIQQISQHLGSVNAFLNSFKQKVEGLKDRVDQVSLQIETFH